MNYFKFLFILLCFYSCSESTEIDRELNNSRSTENLKKVSDFFHYGEIHNEYMTDLCTNFREETSINSTEEALITINKTLIDFTPQNNLFGVSLNESLNNNTKNWQLLLHDSLKTLAESQTMKENVNMLVINHYIDNFEKELLLDFLALANQNLSFQELDSFINNWITLWENQNYQEDSSKGTYSAILLAISKKSTEWWLNNPNCLYENDGAVSRFAPWFAADIAGAAIGLGVSIGSHIATGSSNPDAVGLSMLSGAITGSTGLAGRIGKLISKWWI